MPDPPALGGAHTFCASLQKNTPPAHTFSQGDAGAAPAFGAAVATGLGFVVGVVARSALGAAVADAVLDAGASEATCAGEYALGGASFAGALGAASTVEEAAGRAASARRHMR